MKLEFEIKDIDRDEVVGAMAAQLLNRWGSDDEGNEYSHTSELGKALGRAVMERIDKVATELVHASFDAAIRARLSSAIDEVIAEGWYETDGYGGRRGEKLDLKARISKALTMQRGDSYNRKPPIVEGCIDEAISAALKTEFAGVIAKATADLRARLDTAVTSKVAETIKTALGLR